jgi:hypothetical protein
MATKTETSDGLQAIEETLASFSCEGITYTDEEKALIQQMEAEGLSSEDRIRRLQAFLAHSQHRP